MSYQSNGFPDIGFAEDNGEYYDVECYMQQPGEFYDRTSTETSFYDLLTQLFSANTHQIYRYVRQDLSRLGYTAEIVSSIYEDSYIPPSATEDTSRRLIILVTGDMGDYNDYHFYVQNSDDTWSHKRGPSSATSNCGEHTTVALTNSNISQHIHCCDYTNSNALLFYVNVPGITDFGNNNGHSYPSETPIFVTPLQYCDEAGRTVRTAKAWPSISDETRIRGYVDHVGDIDLFMFDVIESGTYSIEVTAPTSYPIYFNFAQVTNLDSVSFSATYTTEPTGQKVIYQNLAAGNRYCVKVFSGNQTIHESYRFYDIKIIP